MFGYNWECLTFVNAKAEETGLSSVYITLVGIGLSTTQLQTPFGITLLILLAKGRGRIQGMTVEKMVMMISLHLNKKYL